MQQTVALQSGVALSLMTVVGGASGVWVLESAIAPSVAQAYTNRVNITLDWEPGETYQTLISRAEAAARAATQRSFDSDLLITDVAITIIGQNQGIEVPVLTLAASRTQWRSRPDPRYWITHLRNAQALLELGGEVTAAVPPAPVATGNPAVTAPAVSSPAFSQPALEAMPRQLNPNNSPFLPGGHNH